MASTHLLLQSALIACLGVVIYTYIGYPFLLLVVSRIWGRPAHRASTNLKSVSVVLAVYNEERFIGRRLEELLHLVRATGVLGEIIVVSDGSSDATTAIANSVDRDFVRVVELPK